MKKKRLKFDYVYGMKEAGGKSKMGCLAVVNVV